MVLICHSKTLMTIVLSPISQADNGLEKYSIWTWSTFRMIKVAYVLILTKCLKITETAKMLKTMQKRSIVIHMEFLGNNWKTMMRKKLRQILILAKGKWQMQSNPSNLARNPLKRNAKQTWLQMALRTPTVSKLSQHSQISLSLLKF